MNSKPFLYEPFLVKTPLAQLRKALLVATASLLVSTSRIVRTMTSLSLDVVMCETTTLEEALRHGTQPVILGL